MQYNFKLNDTETLKLKKFQKTHYKKCNSQVSVIFTHTGIGVNISVKCNSCGKVKDISDYESW